MKSVKNLRNVGRNLSKEEADFLNEDQKKTLETLKNTVK
jgi:hypothetical protein